ncbi:MAG: cysteine synthase family protein [Candidatus Dadabacteria bacterium]|nr:cysteine synthase family protein [Candidatus Dadabacteria bacterium]
MTEGISPGVEVYVKAEWFNPGGSVKDRPALWMILEGIRSGKLTSDKVVIDSSSGNTAIAYALICAALGYELDLVMPANVNIERKKTILAFGANVIYSDPLEGSDGAIMDARRLKEQNPDKYYMPDQYNNPANPRSHYESTAPEIWSQTQGRITHFFAGMGTSGTIVGTGKRLKEYNEDIKILAIEPAEALHGLEGLKHMATSIIPGIYDPELPDEIIGVETDISYAVMKDVLHKEGLFIGHSGGAVIHAALERARALEHGVLVALLPDGGYRYLSGGLWW